MVTSTSPRNNTNNRESLTLSHEAVTDPRTSANKIVIHMTVKDLEILMNRETVIDPKTITNKTVIPLSLTDKGYVKLMTYSANLDNL